LNFFIFLFYFYVKTHLTPIITDYDDHVPLYSADKTTQLLI